MDTRKVELVAAYADILQIGGSEYAELPLLRSSQISAASSFERVLVLLWMSG